MGKKYLKICDLLLVKVTKYPYFMTVRVQRKGRKMTNKSEVRSDFKHVRFLMQEAEKIMKNSNKISQWEESSEAGQIALELSASASSFLQWVSEQNEKGAK